MFKEVKLPYIADRFIGISLPQGDECIVLSYEGTHIINLKTKKIKHDYSNAEGGIDFNPNRNIFRVSENPLRIHGLYGKKEILKNPQNETLNNDMNKEIIVLKCNSDIIWSYKYNDLSGDWHFISFTEDFQFIFFLIPYELHIFERSEGF